MFVLSETPSIGNLYLAELRDVTIQNDRMRFRRNLERIGGILAYEISKTLHFEEKIVQTPLATTSISFPSTQVVLVSVLRASLPFYQGFLNVFDQAESGFIGAFRQEGDGELTVHLGYHASPNLEGKTVIIADPMLATGMSLVKSIETLCSHGIPKEIHIAAVIAAPEGVKYLKDNCKIPYQIWLGALDQCLDSNSYIVPGLGDAGDLAFGEKL